MSKNLTELEQNILGLIMIDVYYLEAVFEDLNTDIFPSSQGREIITAIKNLYGGNKSIDKLTVYRELRENGSKISPLELSDLTTDIVERENIQVWVKILQQDYAREQYGILGAKMLMISRDLTTDIVIERDNIEALLLDLDNKIFNVKDESMCDTLEQMKVDNDNLLVSDTKIRGVNTGFQKLNDITSGWKEGQFIVLGAASGGGKSALSTFFGVQAALDNVPTHLISIEMTRKEVLLRAASNLSGVKHEYLDRRGVDKVSRERYFDSLDRLNASPLFVDDTPIKSLLDLKFKIKKRIRTNKTRLLIVDYIQIINNTTATSREQQVSEISRVLKEIAREYKISVIGLTQMNRHHDGKNEPFNDMIRESSGLEHNADLIMFLYDPEEEPNNVLKIGKNRGGQKDKYIALHWEKETFNFKEL